MKKKKEHDIIQAAESLLENVAREEEQALADYEPLEDTEAPAIRYDLPAMVPDLPTPPPATYSGGEKFPEVSNRLRDPNGTGLDLFEVKRLNLAALVESLERAVISHEQFPSPDTGFSVASLSEQVQKITKDIEKSQDPYHLYNKIVGDVLETLVNSTIYALTVEMKWLKGEAFRLVPQNNQKPFEDALKAAITRVGPSMQEGMESAKARLLHVLGIKEKK